MKYTILLLLALIVFLVGCTDVETPTGDVVKETETKTAPPEQIQEPEETPTTTSTTTIPTTTTSTTTSTTTITIKKLEETKEKGTLEEIRDALQETKDVLEDYQEKTDKLDECTELCAGDSYDIPAVKDQCWLSCYEIHYYGGMEALDDFIEGLKNE